MDALDDEFVWNYGCLVTGEGAFIGEDEFRNCEAWFCPPVLT